MRVSLTTNVMTCQPLRSFGKAEQPQKPESQPAFSSATVSREEYDKLSAKYDLVCRLAVAQAEQYNKYRAAHPEK